MYLSYALTQILDLIPILQPSIFLFILQKKSQKMVYFFFYKKKSKDAE